MAASSSTIPISIDLQLADLQKKLGEIPGVTGDAAKGMLRELVTASKKAEKAVTAATKAASKAQEKSVEEAREGLLELGDLAGLPADSIKKLGAGLSALANPATLAAVAVGGIGLAATAAVAGVIAIVDAADDLAKEMKDLEGVKGFGVSPEALAAIQGANNAMASLGMIAKQAVLTMGAEFAPTVEKVATFMVKLGLVALDAFNTFADGHNVLRELAIMMVEGLIGSMTGVTDTLLDMARAMAALARSAGMDGMADSLASATDRIGALKHEMATDVVDALGVSVGRLDSAFGSYDERAQKLITTVGKLRMEHQGLKKDTEDLAAGVDALLADWSPGMGLVGSDAVLAAQEVDAAFADITAAIQGVRDAADETGESLERMTSRMDAGAITGALGAVQGGLEAIVGLVAGPVAGAITGLLLNLEGTVHDLTAQLLSLPEILKDAPALITGFVVTLVEAVIPALMAAVPDIAEALVMAVTSPEFLAAIVKLNLMIFNPVTGLKIGVEIARGLWDAFLQGWARFASGEMVEDFRAALVSGVVEAIDEIRAFFERLIDQLKDLFSFDGEGAGKVADTLREVFTLGTAKTQTYGDSPGVVRAGPKGMTVRVAPNDYLGAHRTREGLADMAGGGGGAPGPVLVDFAFAGRAFDGFFARAARTGQTATFLRNGVRTGRSR